MLTFVNSKLPYNHWFLDIYEIKYQFYEQFFLLKCFYIDTRRGEFEFKYKIGKHRILEKGKRLMGKFREILVIHKNEKEKHYGKLGKNYWTSVKTSKRIII